MDERRKDCLKIGIGAFLLTFVMILTHYTELPTWAVILLYAIPYLITGGGVLKEAVENILHGEVFDECFLMSVATLGAFVIGEYPEAVFVMLFFDVGEFFEELATDRSRKSIEALTALRPDHARLETPEGEKLVSPEDVRKGDVIVIRPGERVPLDGKIITGSSSLDVSALTGESLPVEVGEGETVAGGSVNLSGVLRVCVSGSYEESTVARILALVTDAEEHKARPEAFIRKFSRIYTPVVVGLALLLAVIPGIVTGDFRMWITRALMFLVVSCPCALVVSVPLTYFGGIGGASRKGILIKGSDTLEALSKLSCAVFDKTGTLTKGKFEVTTVHPNEMTEDELLLLAARAESGSDHPIAVSLKSACPRNTDAGGVTGITEIAGYGVSAVIDGKKVLVGNEKLMTENEIACPTGCHHDGTTVHLAVDGRYAGHIVISDELKPASALAVKNLRNKGIRTVMLTGDKEETAQKIAGEAGIGEVHAGLLPAAKAEKIAQIMEKEKGTTVFVGDGINDAPVLARADIGAAMGALGSEAAIEAADLVIMDDDPSRLPQALGISRKTARIVRENITFSIFCKAAVLLLSAFGFADLWLAALADVGILVLAVLNALRAMK